MVSKTTNTLNAQINMNNFSCNIYNQHINHTKIITLQESCSNIFQLTQESLITCLKDCDSVMMI